MVDSRGAESGAVVVWEVSHVTIETFFLSFLWSGNTQAHINLTLAKTTDLCESL